MKIRIVLVSLIFAGACSAALAQRKTDLFGFTTGMTYERASANASQRSMSCKSGNNSDKLECQSDAGSILIFFTKKSRVIYAVMSSFDSSQKPDDVAAQLSAQFGVKPNYKFDGEYHATFRWKIGKAELEYSAGRNDRKSHRIQLTEVRLAVDEEKADNRAREPIPKF